MAYWMRDNFSIRFMLYVAGGGVQVSLSDHVKVTCTVTVTVPRRDLHPYDGSVTNENYAEAIPGAPDGNLIDFAQYEPVITDVKVVDA